MRNAAPDLSWYFEALSAFDGSRLTSDHSPAASSFSMQGPRMRNEDRTFVLWSGPRHDRPPLLAAGLLDGIGGSQVGDVAASVAAAHFLAAFVEDQSPIDAAPDLQDALERALSRANAQVCEIFNGASGATLTAVAMTQKCCAAIHVGDSRLYRILPGIAQITRDDTLAGLLGAKAPDLDGDGLLQFAGIGPPMLHQSYDLSTAFPKAHFTLSVGAVVNGADPAKHLSSTRIGVSF